MLTKVLRLPNQRLDTSDTRTGKLVTVSRGLALALLAVLLAAAGCGWSEHKSPAVPGRGRGVREGPALHGRPRARSRSPRGTEARPMQEARKPSERLALHGHGDDGKERALSHRCRQGGETVKTVCGPIDN